ncbi:hypothetical protein [Maribacter dokdonensis]|uniref:hypothetical protein n=1 Tax=Maribacter dokdonensis TaxID=320912 RepID=UPI001B33DEB6|nr:hypothetical protein [Maribacter dokdonensis]
MMQKHNEHGMAVNSDFGVNAASEKIPKMSNQKVFVVKNTETVIWDFLEITFTAKYAKKKGFTMGIKLHQNLILV